MESSKEQGDYYVPDFITCKKLRYVAHTMDFGMRAYGQIFEKESIFTLQDLLAQKRKLRRLSMKSNDPWAKKEYKQLANVATYLNNLFRTNGNDADIEKIFTEDGFKRFARAQEDDSNVSLENFCFGSAPKPYDASEQDIEAFIEARVAAASKHVKADCLAGLQSCQFPIENFVRAVLSSRMSGTKYIVVEGPTQLGKTKVKCLVQGAAQEAKAGVVILTKGNRERGELLDKIKAMVENPLHVSSTSARLKEVVETLQAGGVIVSAQTLAQIGKKLVRAIEACQSENPAFRFIVILDEGDAMFRAREEEQARIQSEQAYRDLLKLSPMMVVMISATIVPMLLHLVDKKDLDQNHVKMFQLKPYDNYVSHKLLIPPKDEYGRNVYLEDENKLSPKQEDGIKIGSIGPIPYTDKGGKLKLVYDLALADPPVETDHQLPLTAIEATDRPEVKIKEEIEFDQPPSTTEAEEAESKAEKSEELTDRETPPEEGDDSIVQNLNKPAIKKEGDGSPSNSTGKKGRLGVLLLDVTNPRVQAEGNVFEKAQMLQNAYFKTERKKFVAIVIIGSGIHVRYEAGRRARFEEQPKELTMSEVIQSIDEDAEYGLSIPIFVFGFSKMNRGLSFRSYLRVPTHIIVRRSQGYSIEDVIQTLGRATFCGREILQNNGFNNVTVLTTYPDLIAADKYMSMTDFIQCRLDQGDSLLQALKGECAKLPDGANPFRHTNRKVGPGSKRNGPGRRIMENIGVLSEDAFALPLTPDQRLRDRFGNDKEAQNLIRVILRLWQKQPQAFEIRDVQDAYYDDIGERINQKDAHKFMGQFCNEGFLNRDKKDTTVVWSLKMAPVLASFVSGDFGSGSATHGSTSVPIIDLTSDDDLDLLEDSALTLPQKRSHDEIL